jgi:hypothetical protein
VTYLRSQAGRLRSVGELGRPLRARLGAGLDPHRFAGHDLVAELRDRRDPDGSVDGQVNLTAFYVLALRAAGVQAGELHRPARWLRKAQARNGGWGIQPQAPSEADSTGAVLQALAVAGGGNAGALEDGARFLRRVQANGGGFALAGTGVVNSQSTAWAIQGLAASGSGGSAIDKAQRYLASLRAADGHYRYSASSDQTPVWVTSQALLAVERAPFPLAAVARAAKPQPRPAEPETAPSPEAQTTTTGAGGGQRQAQPADPVREKPRKRHISPDSKAPVESDSNTASNSTGTEPDTLSAPSPLEPAPAHEETGSSSSSAAPYVLAGLGVLAVALGAGFVWYRRRLP